MTETTLDLTITISKLESDKLVLNKRIAELENAIDNVLISSTNMGSYFEVGIMPIFDLQKLRSEFKGGAD
jgi:hypothetical protein